MSGRVNQHGGVERQDDRAGEPTPLTTSQKSRLRREFRAAYLIDTEAQRHHAINHVYFKFGELYGIPRDEIRKIVQKVKREHRRETCVPEPGAKPARPTVEAAKPSQEVLTQWPSDPSSGQRSVPALNPSEVELAELSELLGNREWRPQSHSFAKHAGAVANALHEGHKPNVTAKAARQLIDWLKSVPMTTEAKRAAEERLKQGRRAANREANKLAAERVKEQRAFRSAVKRTEMRVCKRCGKDLAATPSVRTGLGPVSAKHFVG